MFVTDHFVFLHLPKTGGVYVESVCQENLRMPIRHSRRHAKIGELPAEFEGLPTIGVCRDPWDWYASLFHFAKVARNGATSDLVSLASDGFELGGRVADFECLDPSSLARAKESGMGLMGFLAQEIFPARLDEQWRFETLRKQMLARLSPLCPDRVKFRAAAVSPARNASNKPGLELTYSARGVAMVAAKEAGAIARFGYSPPRVGMGRSPGAAS